MLTVTLTGTAATRPLPDRALSSAVFSADGRHILLDCGEGTQLALHRQRISPQKITLVALTHYHGDHILGLPGLLQTMDTLERKAPLYITGPEEGHEPIWAAITVLAGDLGFPVSFLPTPADGLRLHDLDPQWPPAAVLTSFPTAHRIASQGYRLTLGRMRALKAEKAEALCIPRRCWRTLQWGQPVEINGQLIVPEDVCGPVRKGLTAVYTGDTAPCESVIQAARDADLLVMDATYPDNSHAEKAALYGHATFLQAAETAAAAGVQQLWLTHYSAMIANPEDALPAAKEIFSQTECGTDGKSCTLTFRGL